jgi:hypothetical protein
MTQNLLPSPAAVMSRRTAGRSGLCQNEKPAHRPQFVHAVVPIILLALGMMLVRDDVPSLGTLSLSLGGVCPMFYFLHRQAKRFLDSLEQPEQIPPAGLSAARRPHREACVVQSGRLGLRSARRVPANSSRADVRALGRFGSVEPRNWMRFYASAVGSSEVTRADVWRN